MLRGDVAVEVVVAQSEVQREAANRPLILRVESHVVAEAVLQLVRRGVLRQADRHAVAERVADVRGRGDAIRLEDALLILEAELQRMAASDVRRGEALAVAVLHVRIVVRFPRVEPDARRLLEDGDRVLHHARLTELGPVIDRRGEGAIEQQPAGEGRGPRRLVEAGRTEVIRADRFGRHADAGADRARAADARILEVAEEAEFLFRRRLPRDARRLRLEPLRAVRGPRRIRCVEGRPLRLVPVEAGEDVVVAPFARGGEEPHLVLLDRTAERCGRIVDIQRPIDGGEPARLQIAVQVVARQIRVRVETGQRAREQIAAILRHHVDQHALGVAFRGDAARLQRHLRDERGVELIPRVARHVLHAHAVELRARAAFAVEAAADLRRVDAADIRDAAQAERQADERVRVLDAGR